MNNTKIIFPRAFAFAIDDLGWNEGTNHSQSAPEGPYRVGIKRNFTLDDYRYIVEVAKAAGVRVQCLFILSEMDRENVLARYPTTTYMREKWSNSCRVRDEQVAIMEYVARESAHMEFGLHGTGHEYWPEEGIQRRAEWYNMIERTPWPEDELRGHIEAFREIMKQYDLGPDKGHSFPESFVPCAYSYYWNPTGSYSIGKLVGEAGVKFANTDFAQIPELNPPQEVNGGGFDNGVHVINRMNFGNLWYELNTLPKVTIDMQGTDIIESHWANWLAQDDFMQHEVNDRWINYYRHVQCYETRYIAKNTEQLHSQWLYKKYTRVEISSDGKVFIDNTNMPSEAYQRYILGNMVLKVKCENREAISDARLNGEPIPSYFYEEGFAFLYLPPLAQKKYVFEYQNGLYPKNEFIFNDGTYNIYALEKRPDALLITMKMYGTQTVKVRCDVPNSVISLTEGLSIDGYSHDAFAGMLHLRITASDFQGKRGQITINL